MTPERLQDIAFWARDLGADEIGRACRGVVEKSWPAGAYVCHRGDRFESWIGVASGLMKIGTVSSRGKAVSLAGMPAGMWFGEGSVLKGETRMYDIVALRETRLALMNRATFMWLYENSVGFNRFLVRQFNERLGQFIALVEHDRLLDSVARIARSVAWLFNPVLNPRVGPSLDISQEELGQLAGVSRQVANRALQILEAEGLLRLTSAGLTPADVDALARYGE
ncbi:MAG: Crp/Fnr family transcriptional regulator [Hyphomicrobiales bacterium]|nr:Crp/Fnr family transcriptional regulator [Hyphomicrobiales bacterium]